MKKDLNWTKFYQEIPAIIIKRGSWYASLTLIKVLKNLDIKTCLEIGGGPGLLAKNIAQKLGYKLTLVENNSEAYQLFKKFSNFGNYILQDFFKYKPEKKFDLVFSYGTIEHFFDKKKRLQVIEIHKKLSKKYVLIFVPKNSFLIRNFFHYPERKGFEKLYRKKELEKELRTVGLKPIKFAQNLHTIGFLCEI